MAGDMLINLRFADVRKRMQMALQQLSLRDQHLFTVNTSEWSLSHRLAVYLEQLFPGWHVDCEYNRYGNAPKPAENGCGNIRPDIVIHGRGMPGPHLLVVEVKKNERIDAGDRSKVKHCIDKFNYRWGVCVSVSLASICCEWQGEEVATGNLEAIAWANLGETGYGA